MGTLGSETDSYALPMNADNPTPKIDSASPEATWFAISVNVRNAKASDISAPAAVAAIAPTAALPE